MRLSSGICTAISTSGSSSGNCVASISVIMRRIALSAPTTPTSALRALIERAVRRRAKRFVGGRQVSGATRENQA